MQDYCTTNAQTLTIVKNYNSYSFSAELKELSCVELCVDMPQQHLRKTAAKQKKLREMFRKLVNSRAPLLKLRKITLL